MKRQDFFYLLISVCISDQQSWILHFTFKLLKNDMLSVCIKPGYPIFYTIYQHEYPLVQTLFSKCYSDLLKLRNQYYVSDIEREKRCHRVYCFKHCCENSKSMCKHLCEEETYQCSVVLFFFLLITLSKSATQIDFHKIYPRHTCASTKRGLFHCYLPREYRFPQPPR